MKLTADTITDQQIDELIRTGLVGDAGRAALGEAIDRDWEGKRPPTEHERQLARALCAEILNARAEVKS